MNKGETQSTLLKAQQMFFSASGVNERIWSLATQFYPNIPKFINNESFYRLAFVKLTATNQHFDNFIYK